MTPSQLITKARNKYNATGDTFYSDAELLDLIYEAQIELAREALVIERSYTTTTVASQQQYSFPTQMISIRRVTYDGVRIDPYSFKEDDAITGSNFATTTTGTPQFYVIWNEILYLRPVPDDAKTLAVFGYIEPQAVTLTSTLEVPSQFHMDMVNYVVSEMCAKDENETMAAYYAAKWGRAVAGAKRWSAKKRRGDALTYVKDEELIPNGLIGIV